MFLEIVLLTILTIFQSIFGIGLLVFGTPTFLLLGYTFSETLSIVLPISCFVSLIQIIVSKKTKIKNFTSDFVKFSLPGLIFCLPFSILIISKTNINLLISSMMVIISFLSIYKLNFAKKIYEKIRFKKIIFFLIGCIHGLTNLGGGFISIISSFYYPENKIQIRYSIATSYFVFSIFQLFIIILLKSYYFKVQFLFFIITIPILFFLSNFFFKKISLKNFSKYVYFIVLFYGLFVFIKNILN